MIELRKIKTNNNKKGSILDIFIWMAIGFIAILFFAVWIYGFNILTNTLGGLTGGIIENPREPGNSTSIANISAQTMGKVNNVQTDSLHVLAFVMLFINAVSIPITYFVQKTHPVFFVFFLFVIIASFIASVYISNQYETLMTNEVIGTTLSEFTGASFIMLNLPIWVTIIGIMGAIFLFAGILRDEGTGGSIA
jgi:hypothetical protein